MSDTHVGELALSAGFIGRGEPRPGRRSAGGIFPFVPRPRSRVSARAERRSICVADVELAFDTVMDSAERSWRVLETLGEVSPYQCYDWVASWAETRTDPRRHQALLVTGRLEGAPLFAWPLLVRRIGPWRVASWLGGRDANMVFGPYAEGAAGVLTAERLDAILSAVAAELRIDIFSLRSNAYCWRDGSNPLAVLPRQRSAASIHALRLEPDHAALIARLRSRSTLKTLRKKEAALARKGALAYRLVSTVAEVEALIDAFLAQKAARLAERGRRSDFRCARAAAFLKRVSEPRGSRQAPVELHALFQNGEPLAILGGAVHQGRFCGMINSITDGWQRRYSPGELLIAHVIEVCCARGDAPRSCC